jgi:hypothetical protein
VLVIIDEFKYICSQVAAVFSFFHYVIAVAVWGGVLIIEFRVFMGKISAFEAPCCD